MSECVCVSVSEYVCCNVAFTGPGIYCMSAFLQVSEHKNMCACMKALCRIYKFIKRVQLVVMYTFLTQYVNLNVKVLTLYCSSTFLHFFAKLTLVEVYNSRSKLLNVVEVLFVSVLLMSVLL